MARTFRSLAELSNRLKEVQRETTQKVKEIVEYNTGEIELQAIREAPGPGDNAQTQYGSESITDIVNGRGWTPISQAIGYRLENQGLKGIVFVEQSAGPIAAWIEFGTGQSARSYLATVPPEWRALAQKYYINGKGTIIANPYLLPAFMKYQIEFKKDLEEMAKNITL